MNTINMNAEKGTTSTDESPTTSDPGSLTHATHKQPHPPRSPFVIGITGNVDP